jgi:RHS repeat-associated protein
VQDHVVYDSFGNIVTETHSGNGDRFKFAGLQYDSTAAQYFAHARWYGPAVGRFNGQDPLGFSAGDVSLYRYVGNDPPDATDPTGADEVDPKVSDMLQRLVQNGRFMTMLQTDPSLGPALSKKLQDPTLPTKITFGPIEGGAAGVTETDKGTITLKPELADDPDMAAAYFVHELVHLVLADVPPFKYGQSQLEEIICFRYEIITYINVMLPKDMVDPFLHRFLVVNPVNFPGSGYFLYCGNIGAFLYGGVTVTPRLPMPDNDAIVQYILTHPFYEQLRFVPEIPLRDQ